MTNLLKILTVLLDLIQHFVGSVQRRKREQQDEQIRKDPAAEFHREFGGVPDNEAGLPGDKTGAEIDRDE